MPVRSDLGLGDLLGVGFGQVGLRLAPASLDYWNCFRYFEIYFTLRFSSLAISKLKID